MWKRFNDVPNMDTSNPKEKMRYFIFYPPNKSIRLIDIGESVRVEDIIKLVTKEFNLNIEDSGPSETSIVLSYNGSDLKPTWSVADLSIPSGSIIRCLYREQKAADIYVHCGFNKQILKLFDPLITIETRISTLRKQISNKLGLPLSMFCLEKYNDRQRLYDQMALTNYDIKIHDHLYLKVWRGYEKFINSCIRGFTERYSHDDLSRHYQTQVALYIAAYYGHMELATSVMQQGARSDRPVGEHPSRQWSNESTTEILPEILKCPIHIAVERGHVKMVDLFVRQSILCTQIRDPVTGYLPYQLALSCSLSAETKEEKQRYRVIYSYLHDKQFNLKIPLNSTGEHVSDLLTSTVSASAVHHASTNLISVSLPFYCKIISWYERAREKAWKKYGGRFYYITQTKRVYPKQGLLGYKVLIDGYNNTFEVPPEQLRHIRSGGTLKSDHYIGYSDEERDKIIQMKTFVKQFALDDRKRAKQIAAAHLQQSRRPPILLQQSSSSIEPNKQSSEGISSSTDFSTNFKRSHTIIPDMKSVRSMFDIDNSSVTNLSTLASAPSIITRSEGKPLINLSNQKTKRLSKTASKSFPSTHEEDKHALPIVNTPTSSYSALTNKLEAVIDANKKDSPIIMSSVDAYTLSSTRMNMGFEQNQAAKRQALLTEIKESVEKQLQDQTEKPTHSLPVFSERKSVDVETYIPLPDRPLPQRSSPIKSHLDLDIHQATVKSYERYASATTRSTAVRCLQEAAYFKGKSWLKQVEISKEMVKHHAKRRIRRADDEADHKPVLLPIRTNVVTTSTKVN